MPQILRRFAFMLDVCTDVNRKGCIRPLPQAIRRLREEKDLLKHLGM